MQRVTARAHANIALVKYWGKRDTTLNLPAVGSLSLTLEALSTTTTVAFCPDFERDRIVFEGEGATHTPRIVAFLDRVRRLAGLKMPAEVTTANNFPTGAGLASSASGFAALALAATRAAGLDLEGSALSRLAREGSGSAARSIFGGVVAMHAGDQDDGRDAVAEPVLSPGAWPLAVVIAVTAAGPKAVGSTAGMNRTRDTSPFYPAWVASHADDLDEARRAIAARDLTALGAVTEHSCFKMHGLMLSARPPLLYWNPLTVALVQKVATLRQEGLEAYCTIDAGPQVKVLCRADAAAEIEAILGAEPGVVRVLSSRLGPGAHVVP